MKRFALSLAAAWAIVAPPASGQARPKFKLLLDGVYAFKVDYRESRSFVEFVENGRLDVDYANDPGPGFGAALQYDFVSAVGIRAAFSYVKRDGSARFEGSFPHPLYFDRPRSAQGELAGLSYKETSGHLDLVYTARAGRLELSLFAGGTAIKAEADLAGSVQKDEVFPFDAVSVSLTTVSASDSRIGWNGGAGLDVRFSDHVAFGAQFFYSRATARLPTAGGGTIELDAGGPHVTAGLRFLF
jgi:opacity protein-like surface antigen